MQLSAILIQLAGAVVLLLYSTRMVRTGVERAAGPSIHTLFLRTRNAAVGGALAGAVIAVLLQSSTAVALLVSGFTATGAMAVSSALAIVLGADLGTAIVVQFLSLNLEWLIPAMLAVGGLMFLKSEQRFIRQIGRIIVGIGFILLSLKMISAATEPLRDSQSLPVVVGYLGRDFISAFVGGALLAFLFHSSVAAILLFVAFLAQGVLPLDAALPMLLGANAGGGMVAVWLTRMSHENARRITLANLIIRTLGALIALAAIRNFSLPFELLGDTAPRQFVNFHLVFNAALVVFFLPFIGPLTTLATRLIPDPEISEQEAMKPASALDPAVLSNPNLALASATRELLRMSEQIVAMMTPVMDLFIANGVQQIAAIRKMDEDLNTAHTEIKLYLAELNQGHLTSEQARRSMNLTNFAISLERVGDVISKDLLRLTAEKRKKRLTFSDEGWHDLTEMHARVMANIQLAINVLVSEDVDSARQLVAEKDLMRRLEQRSHDRHIERLGLGTTSSIETSDIHLETVRALKEINSRFAAFAYPILEKYGILLKSRLADIPPDE